MAAISRRARQPKSPRRGDHRSRGASAPGTSTLTTDSGTSGSDRSTAITSLRPAARNAASMTRTSSRASGSVHDAKVAKSARSASVPNQPPVGSGRALTAARHRSSRPPWMYPARPWAASVTARRAATAASGWQP